MRKAMLLLVALCFALFMACEGPVGPMGPQGTQGDVGTSGLPGEDGTDGQDGEPGLPGADGQDGQDGEDGAGTRVAYYSTTPAASNLVYYLIPEITLNDMPLVSVYAAFSIEPNLWFELPQYLELIGGDGMACWLEEGKVTVENCMGCWIRIVIVT